MHGIVNQVHIFIIKIHVTFMRNIILSRSSTDRSLSIQLSLRYLIELGIKGFSSASSPLAGRCHLDGIS
jgi:hypothetical protein